MHRRMFFFDIDGTLIDLAREVHIPTPATEECFRQLHEQGDYVVLATGRARALVPPEVMALGFDGYIFSNGGYVSFHDRLLNHSNLTVPEMEKLEAYAAQSGVQLMFAEQTKIHVKNFDAPIARNFLGLFASFGGDMVDDCWDFTAYRPTMANALFETAESMEHFRRLAEPDFNVCCFKDGILYADIMHKGISKGYGVDCLVRELGINRKHTYAFGDGMNDIQMFERVEHAFAMGCARDRVKRVARFTTDSCQDDGIFNALVSCGAVKPA